MKKRLTIGIVAWMVAISIFAGCGNSAQSSSSTPVADTPSAEAEAPAVDTPSEEVEAPAETQPAGSTMQYLSVAELKADLDAGGSGYIILDVRKKADYDEKRIVGAVSADVDAAVNGNDDSGIANLKVALVDATGSDTGAADTKYALVCYAGKSYAQKATDLLVGMGINGDNIYTLEGGQNAWTEAGDEYTALME